MTIHEGETIYTTAPAVSAMADALHTDPDTIHRYLRILTRKGQLAFHGPPGTGKTFTAQKLADLVTAETDGFVDLIQFHPAYEYEDFIQGIRPEVVDGQVSYHLKAGRFLEVVEKAQATDAPCVLIIDELNRANLGRILGELMHSLEYRDSAIPLASGNSLKIPSNLYIIATFNTADRSTALVDYALRRRFAFIRLEPDYAVLKKYHQQTTNQQTTNQLITLLQKINADIPPDYQLGISYFLIPDLATHLPDIWQTEIEPYLLEYFYADPTRVDPYRWQKVSQLLAPNLFL